jgi:hypothetical protein
MRRRRKTETTGRAALVWAAIVAFSRVAAAEPESVRIEYTAPAGCPDAAAFMRSLQARTAHFRQVAADEQTRVFVVRVDAQGSAFSGRLEVHSPDGSTSVRSVDAAVCDEVSDALALMTALAIDPNALTSGTSSQSSVEPTPEPPTVSTPKRPPPRSAGTVAAGPVPAAQKASAPWRWSAGLLGHMTFELSPSSGYGGSLFVDAEAPLSSALGPAVRAGIFVTQSDVQRTTSTAARFQWAALSVEGCPIRLSADALRLAIHPCLAFRVGVIHAEGLRISLPKQTYNAWSDVGPTLRMRAAATPRLLLEAQAGLVLPLHRPTFEVLDMGSPTTVYRVPQLGGLAAIGIAFRFR